MKLSLKELGSIILGLVILFIFFPALGSSLFPSITDFFQIDPMEIRRIFNGTLWTAWRSIIALTLGYLFGILSSLPRIMSQKYDSYVAPWYSVFRITPSTVWIPILLYIGVRSERIPLIIAALVSGMYVAMYISKAVNSIPEEEKMAIHAMKFSFMWKMKNCYYPIILSSSVLSLKIGGGIAFILVIVGEALVLLDPGLGYLLSSYQTSMHLPAFWLTAVLIAFTSTVIYFFSYILAKRFEPHE